MEHNVCIVSCAFMHFDTVAYRKRPNKVPLLYTVCLFAGILILLILSDHSDTAEVWLNLIVQDGPD